MIDNNLTGDNRLAHLRDRMRDCQKVFFNLKSALIKIEKQRKAFIRRQKTSNEEMRSLEGKYRIIEMINVLLIGYF